MYQPLSTRPAQPPAGRPGAERDLGQNTIYILPKSCALHATCKLWAQNGPQPFARGARELHVSELHVSNPGRLAACVVTQGFIYHDACTWTAKLRRMLREWEKVP